MGPPGFEPGTVRSPELGAMSLPLFQFFKPEENLAELRALQGGRSLNSILNVLVTGRTPRYGLESGTK